MYTIKQKNLYFHFPINYLCFIKHIHTPNLAEAVGFEPTIPYGMAVFKTACLQPLTHASDDIFNGIK